MATEIELTHQGGDTKEVEVFGRCGRWAFVWWPGAGMYDLDLRTGELRRGKQIVREWFASPEERERLAKLPQEAFGNGAG